MTGLAILPVVIILILMIGFRWGAVRAGSAGYLTSLIIGLAFFGATPNLLAYAHAKALFLSLDVLLIIWTAFLLYRVVDEAGAIAVIAQALNELSSDRVLQALIIGWVFTSFLQGTGGFGVPVAVTAPILMGIGFSPITAVLIPSIGHGWAVTFGSLGSSFQALVATSGLADSTLTFYSAIFLSISGILAGMMVAHSAGGWKGITRALVPIFIFGIVMSGVHFVVAQYGVWNIASLSGALAGLVVVFPFAYWVKRSAQKPVNNNENDLNPKQVITAVSGYLILVIIILSVQFAPGLKETLSLINIQFRYPELSSNLGFITAAGSSRNMSLLTHTGAVLLYSSVLAYLTYRLAGWYRPGSLKRIIGDTSNKMVSTTLSILVIVCMAVIMEFTGMTNSIAQSIANFSGSLFPAFSPWIGALGAFITGSNTNSNVIFTILQMKTAEMLGYSVPVILAAQTAGAAIASVVAPAKIVVGASTTGLDGKEGEIIRKLLGYVVVAVLLISLLAVITIGIINIP